MDWFNPELTVVTLNWRGSPQNRRGTRLNRPYYIPYVWRRYSAYLHLIESFFSIHIGNIANLEITLNLEVSRVHKMDVHIVGDLDCTVYVAIRFLDVLVQLLIFDHPFDRVGEIAIFFFRSCLYRGSRGLELLQNVSFNDSELQQFVLFVDFDSFPSRPVTFHLVLPKFDRLQA